MDTTQRETKARRHLAKFSFRLNKAPARHWTRAEYGVGYQILDHRNMIVQGCCQREYEMTLEQVEEHVEWIARCALEARVREAAAAFVADGGNMRDFASITGEVFDIVCEAEAA